MPKLYGGFSIALEAHCGQGFLESAASLILGAKRKALAAAILLAPAGTLRWSRSRFGNILEEGVANREQLALVAAVNVDGLRRHTHGGARRCGSAVIVS
jgi:hypothetical protein